VICRVGNTIFVKPFDRFYKSCVFVGFDGLRGGKLFPRTPISTLCRAFISRGLRYSYRGGPFGALLVGLWPPPLHRPLRGLRQRAFASLRSTASYSLLAARFGFAEPCGSLTSATRRLPRFCAGQKRSGPGESRVATFGAGREPGSNVWGREKPGSNVWGRERAGRQRLGPGGGSGKCLLFHLQFSSGKATLGLFNQQGVLSRQYKLNYNYN